MKSNMKNKTPHPSPMPEAVAKPAASAEAGSPAPVPPADARPTGDGSAPPPGPEVSREKAGASGEKTGREKHHQDDLPEAGWNETVHAIHAGNQRLAHHLEWIRHRHHADHDDFIRELHALTRAIHHTAGEHLATMKTLHRALDHLHHAHRDLLSRVDQLEKMGQ